MVECVSSKSQIHQQIGYRRLLPFKDKVLTTKIKQYSSLAGASPRKFQERTARVLRWLVQGPEVCSNTTNSVQNLENSHGNPIMMEVLQSNTDSYLIQRCRLTIKLQLTKLHFLPASTAGRVMSCSGVPIFPTLGVFGRTPGVKHHAGTKTGKQKAQLRAAEVVESLLRHRMEYWTA